MNIKNRIKKQYPQKLFIELYIIDYLMADEYIFEEKLLEDFNISSRTLQRYIKEINDYTIFTISTMHRKIDENTNYEYNAKVYGPNHSKDLDCQEKLYPAYHLEREEYISLLDRNKANLAMKGNMDLTNRLFRCSLIVYCEATVKRQCLMYMKINENEVVDPRIKELMYNVLLQDWAELVFPIYRKKNPKTLQRDLELAYDVFNYTNPDDELLNVNMDFFIEKDDIFPKKAIKEAMRLYKDNPLAIGEYLRKKTHNLYRIGFNLHFTSEILE